MLLHPARVPCTTFLFGRCLDLLIFDCLSSHRRHRSQFTSQPPTHSLSPRAASSFPSPTLSMPRHMQVDLVPCTMLTVLRSEVEIEGGHSFVTLPSSNAPKPRRHGVQSSRQSTSGCHVSRFARSIADLCYQTSNLGLFSLAVLILPCPHPSLPRVYIPPTFHLSLQYPDMLQRTFPPLPQLPIIDSHYAVLVEPRTHRGNGNT